MTTNDAFFHIHHIFECRDLYLLKEFNQISEYVSLRYFGYCLLNQDDNYLGCKHWQMQATVCFPFCSCTRQAALQFLIFLKIIFTSKLTYLNNYFIDLSDRPSLSSVVFSLEKSVLKTLFLLFLFEIVFIRQTNLIFSSVVFFLKTRSVQAVCTQ